MYIIPRNNLNGIRIMLHWEHYENIPNVNIIQNSFQNYANLDYKCIIPLIKKYFSPSAKINEIINNIEKKNIILCMRIHLLYIIEEQTNV